MQGRAAPRGLGIKQELTEFFGRDGPGQLLFHLLIPVSSDSQFTIHRLFRSATRSRNAERERASD